MGLRLCCFASGSKGNCTFVSDGETNILIDLGISALRAEKYVEALGVDPDKIAVFVTHSHSDHVGGIEIFCKRHKGAAVHCQKESARAVMDITGVLPVVDERMFSLGKLNISALTVPHDVPCFSYVIAGSGGRLAVATDIGEVRPNVIEAFGLCDIVMLEANHDVQMLRRNPRYTPQLKARIASGHGHLNNADCAEACLRLAGLGVRSFVLAHLSEENNTPDLAESAVRGALSGAGYTDVMVTCASQNKPTGMFEIC